MLSEVMRDVDLFVARLQRRQRPDLGGQGPEAHRRYWHAVAFSDELSASAQTRQIVLERLVPRLEDRGAVRS